MSFSTYFLSAIIFSFSFNGVPIEAKSSLAVGGFAFSVLAVCSVDCSEFPHPTKSMAVIIVKRFFMDACYRNAYKSAIQAETVALITRRGEEEFWLQRCVLRTRRLVPPVLRLAWRDEPASPLKMSVEFSGAGSTRTAEDSRPYLRLAKRLAKRVIRRCRLRRLR